MGRIYNSIDPHTVARLQIAATRSPNWYRAQVAALSILGDLLLTATQVLPLALPIALGLLLFQINQPVFMGAGVLALLLFIWMARPTSHLVDKILPRSDAPALYELVDSLRRHLDVPNAPRIVLDNSFNAGALQLRGPVGLFGGGFVPYLDIPLMQALTQQDLRAIISHEL